MYSALINFTCGAGFYLRQPQPRDAGACSRPGERQKYGSPHGLSVILSTDFLPAYQIACKSYRLNQQMKL